MEHPEARGRISVALKLKGTVTKCLLQFVRHCKKKITAKLCS